MMVAEEFNRNLIDYAVYMVNNAVEDFSKTVYLNEVTAAAKAIREAYGLKEDEEITKEMLDVLESEIIEKKNGKAVLPLRILADTAF